MLESWLEGYGNIYWMNVKGAFPRRALYQPRELYEALKETPLYDAECRQWNRSMTNEQEVDDTQRWAATQLFGVLAEALFDKEAAREMYEALKATPLYDAARRQWNLYINERVRATSCVADVQLLGVLAEALFNKEAAREMYEALKATSLYDAARGQWNWLMSQEQNAENTRCYAHVQLLGVLVEALFDEETAREKYEALKTTPLYDAERAQWNWYMNKGQGQLRTDRHATTQLLGILVEAKFLACFPRPLAEKIPPLPVIEEW